MKTKLTTTLILTLATTLSTFAALSPTDPDKLKSDGQFAEALDGYKSRLFEQKSAQQPYRDVQNAINCLERLGRINEIDTFREQAVETYPQDSELLHTVAESYMNVQHYGFIIAGEFERGPHRGGTGKPVNAFERDRIRAIQLMLNAVEAAKKQEKPGAQISTYWLRTSDFLLSNRGYSEAWRLQYLSDLTTLPDYEDGHYYYGRSNTGAPVDEDGNPILHHIPESWGAAKTDGERWRWCLNKTVELQPGQYENVQYRFASFLQNQFGVQTMRNFGIALPRFADFADAQADVSGSDADTTSASGTYALHTLEDNETIARLASGVRRFTLPDEFNYIRIFKELRGNRKGYGSSAADMLCNIFENRRQYPKAADAWRVNIENFGDHHGYKLDRLNQIIGNWGEFEPLMSQAPENGVSVDYRFRNGSEVTFTAYEIKVETLLNDIRDYLKSNPNKLDHNKVDPGQIGYLLVEKNERRYLGRKSAQWNLDLDPRPNHFDRRITVQTPLKDSGAYLLIANLADGNTSRIVLWVNDTIIVRKPLENRQLYYVADAVTGKPVANAVLDIFGYRVEWKDNGIFPGHHTDVTTQHFAEFADSNGMFVADSGVMSNRMNWLVTATTEDRKRLAFLGFDGIWYQRRYDPEYNATKVFGITDRPVYRPNHTVKFNIWTRHAQYDKDDVSQFANNDFTVRIYDPQSTEIHSKTMKADEYGGVHGEITLADDATLGVYRITLDSHGQAATFRVEEYKKPEFEVKIDAPEKPITLGEEFRATIRADYLFGAPVTEAKVHYKVTRTPHDTRWYPIRPWDWFYEPGYWWFAYDYTWYPGWRHWGVWAPRWHWWPRSTPPPELVAENTVEIGEDGTVQVVIDSTLAKALHGDTDHKYSITAEVTDQSRRTIVGSGSVIAAREPFRVYPWIHRGYYRVGDTVQASVSARTADGKPVGNAICTVNLLKITYDKTNTPVENQVRAWTLETDPDGLLNLQFPASEAGQYRIACTVTGPNDHQVEGGYIFLIRGEGFDGREFHFNQLELTQDKQEYAPGDTAKLQINTDRMNSTVLLFPRPTNGVYLEPEVLRLDGKSTVHDLEITRKDMPNIYVEALTISGGKVHTVVRELVVPPADRVLDVSIESQKDAFKPGEKAQLKISVKDEFGKPFQGALALTVYDRAVEYISGGSNIPDIREFFWKWRRHHNPTTYSSDQRWSANLAKQNETVMRNIGVFGDTVADDLDASEVRERKRGRNDAGVMTLGASRMVMKSAAPAPEMMMADMVDADMVMEEAMPVVMEGNATQTTSAETTPEVTVRKQFADTAFWAADIRTDENGIATVEFDMPENLTGWKIRTWAMGHGTRVGQAQHDVVTTKDLLLRLQAPRFFVEKDEVVLSANIHNYLDSTQNVRAVLELDGSTLELFDGVPQEQIVKIEPNHEARIDWRVKAVKEGEAVVRMKAIGDDEADAMEMRFPVKVHGMTRQESYSTAIRIEENSGGFDFTVPAERRIDETWFELRFSPTLAGAMVDALPYLVEYPYGCTEQTLNRFVPTVITHSILQDMGLDLAAIRDKRTNLNAQELGDAQDRAQQWKHWKRNPVFDEEEVKKMVKDGVKRLVSMQLSDGGWGWFSGWGEQSYPHTTAVVVHGLRLAHSHGAAVPPVVIDRGIEWLVNYQNDELQKLKNFAKEKHPWKRHADSLDAFVFMILTQAGRHNREMEDFLYRDRLELPVYAAAMFGVALTELERTDRVAMISRNIEQYLVMDEENQTAYLKLPNGGYWWYWYGSENEAHAYYLKLLSRTEPNSDKAAWLVKYLLNNRKHGVRWDSTRDTAVCIEALAEYLVASGEIRPDMTVEILLDGEVKQTVRITPENLFTFDNAFRIEGRGLTTGEHRLDVRKTGQGPLYMNGYLSMFSLQDPIPAAGLELKVQRDIYRLVPVDKSVKVAGSRGQALEQKIEAYKREKISDNTVLKSGDLIEIELVIESKNDYEYVVIEDMKAAGCEPVEVRSGYNGNELRAYVEFRDDRVAFFTHRLMRGKHSVSYRLRAETPGRFSALPTKAYAMYAPELKANSDENKVMIED